MKVRLLSTTLRLTAALMMSAASGVDTVRFTGPVKSVTITAPSPTVWQLPPPYNVTGRLRAVYNIVIHENPCPPLGELVLDDPAIRDALRQSLAASRPDPSGANRREHGGYVYVRDDGTPFLVEETQPGFFECKSNLKLPGDVPPIAGAHLLAYWHTHPNNDFEAYYSQECKGSVANPTQTAGAGNRDQTGGGSEGDWLWANSTGKAVYLIAQGERVYRLDPGTEVKKRDKNTNRWKFDNNHLCLKPR